jgi:hypothetical protein
VRGARFVAVDLRWCDRVRGALTTVIESELDGLRVEDPLEAEIVVHRRFLEERAAHFAGREDKLADVARHLDGTAPQPLYVSGVSGAGQSAFMAGAALATVADARGALVVARCVGATSPSVDARLLLDGITRELARASGEPDPVMPGSLDDVAVEIVRYTKASARTSCVRATSSRTRSRSHASS